MSGGQVVMHDLAIREVALRNSIDLMGYIILEGTVAVTDIEKGVVEIAKEFETYLAGGEEE